MTRLRKTSAPGSVKRRHGSLCHHQSQSARTTARCARHASSNMYVMSTLIDSVVLTWHWAGSSLSLAQPMCWPGQRAVFCAVHGVACSGLRHHHRHGVLCGTTSIPRRTWLVASIHTTSLCSHHLDIGPCHWTRRGRHGCLAGPSRCTRGDIG